MQTSTVPSPDALTEADVAAKFSEQAERPNTPEGKARAYLDRRWVGVDREIARLQAVDDYNHGQGERDPYDSYYLLTHDELADKHQEVSARAAEIRKARGEVDAQNHLLITTFAALETMHIKAEERQKAAQSETVAEPA